MKTRLRHVFLLFLILGSLLSLSAGNPDLKIIFTAYSVEGKLTFFALKTFNDDRSVKWLEMEDSYLGYTLKGFDGKTEELTLSNGTDVLSLHPVFGHIPKTMSDKEAGAQGLAKPVLSSDESKAYFTSYVAQLLAKAKQIPSYKPYDPEFEKNYTGPARNAIDRAKKKAEEAGTEIFIMDVDGKPAFYKYVPIEKRYPEETWKNLSVDDLKNLNIAAAIAGTEYNMALANAGLLVGQPPKVSKPSP